MEKWRTGHMMWHATTTIVFWMYLLCRFCSFLLYNFCVVYIKVTFFFFLFFLFFICVWVYLFWLVSTLSFSRSPLFLGSVRGETHRTCSFKSSRRYERHIRFMKSTRHSTSNTQHTHMTCTTGKLYHTFAVADSRSGLLDVPERTGWEECFRLLFEYECSALYI